MSRMKLGLLLTIVGTLFSDATFADDLAVKPIDFNRDIRSILSNKCFTCHGPDEAERQASLRLDTQAGAITPADSGDVAIVPGKPEQSALIARISSDDESERMPPADSGKKLTPKEVQLLSDWVQQGAAYSAHWSYIKPVRPELPTLASHQDWPKNEIDHFILARLQQEKLAPSAEADRYAIVRRLSLDLTGLPPTVEEVDQFVNDQDPQAYENLVDRLLEKKAYGEHWARMWLDLARYADSAGYADDPPRTIWGFRDYVIRSLNDNKPFDQFTIEQIAGDLLPNPTDEQLIATAFHRNTLTNNEGGTNDEEYRNVAVVDRVNTTMAVWMGTTMACAQCHTHKYDPITQEEYFRFFAIFNNSEDADRRDESPLVEVWTDEQRKQESDWKEEVGRLKAELVADSPALREAQAAWEAKVAADERQAVTGRFVRVEIVDREEFLSLAEVQVFRGDENVARKGKATQSSTDYDGPPELAIDGNTDGDYAQAKSTTHTKKDKNPWWLVELTEPMAIDRIAVWNRTDGNVGSRLNGYRVSILDDQQQPLWKQDVAEAPSPSREFAITGVPAEVLAIVKVPADTRDDKQKQQLADYYRSISPELKPVRERLGKVEKQLAALTPYTTVPVMRDLPSDKQRTTKIQLRGNFLQTSDEVTAGVPAAFNPVPENEPINRLAVAKWLVDENNPLTARVVANRYWEAIFGVGIVRTSEEFGSQGELPSNPELLDWLATELIRLKWDRKAFLKLLVTSATYRQSSAVTGELVERDPDNRLLARGPRFRLSAEMIRDQSLFASGLLSDRMYGPPVKPPQPNIGLSAAFGGGIDWTTSDGDDRYRRGLYTTWRRSNPYPSMAAFDAPNREVCTITRDRTNTPLQALVTLNDPVYIEAAQALSRRIASSGETTEAKLTHGFRICLARPPSDAELSRLVSLYNSTYAEFKDAPEQAMKMATDPLGSVPEGSDVIALAAWTVVGNVLLNLDEMFLKR
ncbi:MAG: DUF1553 domain-containing protein [Planctomycetaceae bacterium]|nr:DUF1553 domain-containing protein [Planctomycetales bacterium]MCB9941341.1 DUF1553 domain-containing protein [Planctomycetaceae bacterium]